MGEVKDREFLVLREYPRGTRLAYTAAMVGRRGFIGLILLATAARCGGGNGDRPDSAVTQGDAWVELGTGTVGFEELEPDSDLVLVAGPQGGHHFVLNARMRGLQPGDPEMPGTVQNPSTRFTVWSEAGDQLDIDPPPYRLGYEAVGDGVYGLGSGHIIQVREEEVAALYGTRVRVRVELTDADGATASDERWVVAVEDTGGGEADAGPPPAWVEVGTGDTDFEPLAAEGDIVRYSGAQGGNHFFLHARMMGLAPEDATTRFRVYDEGGGRIDASGTIPLDYEDAGGGTYTLPYGPQVVLDPFEVPGIGDRVRVTVQLNDTGGMQVTDERWVIVVAP